jgi:hypothetical protein
LKPYAAIPSSVIPEYHTNRPVNTPSRKLI